MRRILQGDHPRLVLWLATSVALACRLVGLGAFAGYVYDEAYYVASAQTLLGLKVGPGAAVHPPLVPYTDPNLYSAPPFGKELIAASIWLFGNHAWAWRLPGALLGSTLPAAGWVLARLLFPEDRRIAPVAASLLAVEGMGIGLSRAAILDSTAVPLAIWGIALVLWAGLRWLDPGRPRSAASLGLVGGGFVLGLAAADKWTGAQALLTAGALIGLALVRRLKTGPPLSRRRAWGFVALAVVALVPVPVLTYGLTYFWGLGRHGFANGVPPHLSYVAAVWYIQRRILAGMWALRFVHPWLAPVSTWFLLPRPIYLISSYRQSWHAAVYALANPLLVWAGGAGLLIGLPRALNRSWPRAWPGTWFSWASLWMWTLAFYGTWWLTPRSKFDYYFYPMTVAVALAAAAWLPALTRWLPKLWAWGVYVAPLALSTLYLFPLWVGVSLPSTFYSNLVWSPTWNPLPTSPSPTAAPLAPVALPPVGVPPAADAVAGAAPTEWGYSAGHEAVLAESPVFPAAGMPAAGPVDAPVAVDGRRVYAAIESGRVAAWAAPTGRLLWATTLPNQVHTMPLVVPDRGRPLVVVGVGNAEFSRYRRDQGWIRGTGWSGLAALNAATGQVVWTLPTQGEVMATPCYHDGRLYVVTGSGQFLAVRSDDGHVVWRLHLGGFDSYSSPMLVGQDVVFATNRYLAAFPAASSTVWAVNIVDRRVAWDRSLPVVSGLSDCTPAVGDGAVYIAGVVQVGGGTTPVVRSRLFALATQSGRLLWSASLGGGRSTLSAQEEAPPLATGGAVYIVNPADGEAYAFSAQGGRQLWHTALPGGAGTVTAPVAAGPHLIWPVAGGQIDVLAEVDGRVVRQDFLPTGPIGASSPVLAGSLLWFGTLGGYVDIVPMTLP
jgi:outer membrane protein assembly factor BamB/4-amino-4-deoxy-L-arabinose transferase-like glycosyltransferase